MSLQGDRPSSAETRLRAQASVPDSSWAQETPPWQLRPHFVFNALHSIAVLTRRCDRDRALAIIASLGDLLQHSIMTAGRFVKLEDEVAFARCYLEVERVRFDIPLSVESDLDPSAVGVLVPSFVLQPIVEDLVHHTVDQHPDAWSLQISARARGDRLEIELRNPGPPDTHPRSLPHARALGIAELRNRLEAEYGHAFRLVMVSDPSGALVARLQIPLRSESGGHVGAATSATAAGAARC